MAVVSLLAACQAFETAPTQDQVPGTQVYGQEPPGGRLARRTFRIIAEGRPDRGTEALQIIEARPGVTNRFLLAVPRDPKAVVILFAGGAGRLGIDISGRIRKMHNNFLIRSRRLFVANGLAVATLDAPSDRNGAAGLRGGFRTGQEHAADIAAVTAYLRSRLRLPVWLVGTSRGTLSVGNAAIRNREIAATRPDGLVLSASVTQESRRNPDHLMTLRLAAIDTPTLIVHHRRDGCFVSPFRGAERLEKP